MERRFKHKQKKVNITLSKETLAYIEVQAAFLGISCEQLITMAITDYIREPLIKKNQEQIFFPDESL